MLYNSLGYNEKMKNKFLKLFILYTFVTDKDKNQRFEYCEIPACGTTENRPVIMTPSNVSPVQVSTTARVSILNIE